MEVNTNELFKTINQMKAENDKLQDLKTRYVEIAEKLNVEKEKMQNALAEIDKLVQVLDPFKTAVSKDGRKKRFLKSVGNERRDILMQKMIEGTQITVKLVEQMWTDMQGRQAYNLLKPFLKMNKFKHAYDGRAIRFYYER